MLKGNALRIRQVHFLRRRRTLHLVALPEVPIVLVNISKLHELFVLQQGNTLVLDLLSALLSLFAPLLSLFALKQRLQVKHHMNVQWRRLFTNYGTVLIGALTTTS